MSDHTKIERISDLLSKITLCIVLALLATYLGISSLGASGGNWSHAVNAAMAVLIGAWIGWLIREFDDESDDEV